MDKTSKKRLIIIISLIVIAFALFLIYQLNQDKDSGSTPDESITFKENETIVYLEDKQAENDVLFTFDYSCPWCTVWIQDVFPDLQKYIESGEVKFRTQSLGLLNPTSLKLAEVDQNMKVHYPQKYFTAFLTLVQDSTELDITDDYLKDLANEHDMDLDVLLTKPDLDMSELTNDYLEGFAIESVPTVIVNGEKLEDPFDFEELESLLTKDK